MLKYLLFLLLILTCLPSYSQVLSGFVEDISTGERLAGVVLKTRQQGKYTNHYGFFSIISQESTFTLTISCLGYQAVSLPLHIEKDTVLLIKLQPQAHELNEVTVHSSKNQTALGSHTVSLEMVKKMPALLGEADIMKTLQYLPGVQAGTEATAGLNVRGGSPDQNLILLDGVPVYNINHLFGFFSVINPDAIANIDFFKSYLPARYAGRLSSVIDLTMKEGNREKWTGNFNLSPITTHFTLEGPLQKKRSSVVLSGRTTWLNAFLWAGYKLAKSENSTTYGFYDFNAKWNYTLSEKDHIYASFYAGQDRFSNRFNLGENTYAFQFSWGNTTSSFRWNRIWNNRLFSNLTTYYTHYQYRYSERYQAEKTYNNMARSGIKDWGLKMDFEQTISSSHTLTYGLGAVTHQFRPEVSKYEASSLGGSSPKAPPLQALEWSLYGEHEWRISPHIRLNTGIHYMAQRVQEKVYQQWQPRFQMSYWLSSESALKLSYGRASQFLHLLTNGSLGLPTDLWVPITYQIPPETADQISAGYSIGTAFRFTSEVYYKKMKGVLEYKAGSSLNDRSTWQEKLTSGISTSKGLELMFQKNTGKTTGWLSYTLSKTDRIFSELNAGKSFPFKYDRRHNLALIITHKFSPTQALTLNGAYYTGAAITLSTSSYNGISPEGTIEIKDQNNSFYNNLGDLTTRNNFRIPAYHRMDLSYSFIKDKRKGKRSWIISIYNVYNRHNPFFIYYEKQELKQFSLFPIIPSIAYKREF
ncbi:MAG: TonB-dependent receptor plug domain-containing protein [Siphonobacter sp.]